MKNEITHEIKFLGQISIKVEWYDLPEKKRGYEALYKIAYIFSFFFYSGTEPDVVLWRNKLCKNVN